MASWLKVVPDHLKMQEMCNEAVHIEPLSLAYVPDRFKTEEMRNEAVHNKLCMLLFVSDHFKTMEMCNEIMRAMPEAFHRIPDGVKTQEMCKTAIQVGPSSLQFVPVHLKAQEMCDKAVRDDSSSLQYVPDWFVRKQQVNMWYCDYYNDDDYDELTGWHNGYQKRKTQKAEIKEDLMPITWHPSRWWDWCVSEDEGKQRKIVEVTDSCF